MGLFGKSNEDKDPDKVGRNPTGRERKSSAGQRRKKDNKLYKDTPWDKGKDKK